MSASYDIVAVEHLGGHRLRLRFADGLSGDVDLADQLAGELGPVLAPLKDVGFFGQVAIDADLGTVVWPNGADLAPDVLHRKVLSPT